MPMRVKQELPPVPHSKREYHLKNAHYILKHNRNMTMSFSEDHKCPVEVGITFKICHKIINFAPFCSMALQLGQPIRRIFEFYCPHISILP